MGSTPFSLSTHGLGNIYVCIRAGQRCNQSPLNIEDGAFDKNSQQRKFKDVN